MLDNVSVIITKDGCSFSSISARYFADITTFNALLKHEELRGQFLDKLGQQEIVVQVRKGSWEKGFIKFKQRPFGTFRKITHKFKGGYVIND